MFCPYCNQEAVLMSTEDFYGLDYGSNLYVCFECDARVGTHGKTKKPLGTMANEELRELRKKCHSLLDVYWKSGKYTRTEVYRRLAKIMELPKEKAHIGMFDEEQCEKLISFLEEKEL